jgi:hypothetical protein
MSHQSHIISKFRISLLCTARALFPAGNQGRKDIPSLEHCTKALAGAEGLKTIFTADDDLIRELVAPSAPLKKIKEKVPGSRPTKKKRRLAEVWSAGADIRRAVLEYFFQRGYTRSPNREAPEIRDVLHR